MRLTEDVKRTVVFLGLRDSGGKFQPKGTAFFIGFDESAYLVTVRHVASKIGSGTFVMGLNQLDERGGHIIFDPREPGASYRWFTPDDSTVDLAIMPANKDFEKAGYSRLLIPAEMIDWASKGKVVGIGDVCHAVGLFSRFPGKTKHMPVVHSGNVASLADGEKITVRDRCSHLSNAEIESDGYLIEMANLPGLSGAPVFFRGTHELDLTPLFGAETRIAAPSMELHLLGVWTGSWEGFEVGTERSGMPDLRVPVGMGFVTPVSKLLELLRSDDVTEEREAWKTRVRAQEIAKA